jgi:DNA end-binding protein Ku
MAKMLVDEMSAEWDPAEYQDEFKAAIMGLVEQKAQAGKTETVIAPQEEAPAYADNVIDLTDLLQRSLRGGASKGRAKAEAKPAKKAAPRSSAVKKAPAKKAAKSARQAKKAA